MILYMGQACETPLHNLCLYVREVDSPGTGSFPRAEAVIMYFCAVFQQCLLNGNLTLRRRQFYDQAS